MSNVTINSLPTANTIDPVQDLLPIYTANVQATQSISRNTYLGITGSPVGNTDVQTISNKTLGNTNALTIKDGSLTIQNSSSTTKQAQFSAASITAGQTRTFTLPDLSDTLVTLTATQTLTNKTLTSPVISTPTITNAIISADTITGFSVSNSGSIYGISVTTGVITSANSIGSGTIVQNGVAASQLATNAITLGYAQITSNFTTSSASFVQVTGLTLTVTIPAGGRRIRIIVFSPSISSTASGIGVVSIWDGTVGSGIQIGQGNSFASGGNAVVASAIVTPAAGSKTYNVGFETTAGTGTFSAASTGPAYLLVEAI